MDALQSDIDSLENEKLTLQTRLSGMTKKQMFDNLTRGSGVGNAVGTSQSLYILSEAIATPPDSPSFMIVAQGIIGGGMDSPHLLEQIKSLKSTVGWLRSEQRSQQCTLMKVECSDHIYAYNDSIRLITMVLDPFAALFIIADAFLMIDLGETD
mgnify:FL=1